MSNDDNTKPKTDDQQSQTSSLPPVIVVEDVLPPMPQQNSNQDILKPSPVTDSGTAAPDNDIRIDTVMPAVVTTGPKKKFAGGKVIATILGLFLLVGGLGAGIFLVGQNQNISEKAAQGSCNSFDNATECNSSCSPIKADGFSYECKWFASSGTCGESSQVCGSNGGGGVSCDENTCGHGEGTCCVPGTTTSGNPECVGVTHWTTCNPGLICNQGVGCFPPPGSTTPPNPTSTPTVAPTVTPTITPTTTPTVRPSSTPTVAPTVTPTAPPISAQCQNIQAYSATKTLLTAGQLANLRVGDTVIFCVAGVATGGSFDRAQFTINGVEQKETTLTTANDTTPGFCSGYYQSYVIPAATVKFDITARIHHVTLGWK